MPTWLLSTPEKTVAVVKCGGRRQALRALQFEYGGTIQHSGSYSPTLIGSRAGSPITAEEARKVQGEYIPAREVVAA